MPGDQGDRRGVAEQHGRPEAADRRDEFIQFGLAHFKCRDEVGSHYPVTNLANFVLGGQFDRATPDHNFPIADIDIPPAGRAPFGGHIVTDPFIADEEN